NTLFRLYDRQGLRWPLAGAPDDGIRARTIASAIEISRPVNLPKALRALAHCDGVVREVSDQEIMDAKAQVGAGGFGCEPASAASVAGPRKLREKRLIHADNRVVCILTGDGVRNPNLSVGYHCTDPTAYCLVVGRRRVQ